MLLGINVFLGDDQGLFWVFMSGYWSYEEKKFWARVDVPGYME